MDKTKGLMGNLMWKFGERIVAQVVSLLVSIILARLLDPDHYGVVSMVMVFITFANVFVSDGFGAALIQKKDADDLDFSTVLYFSLIISVVIYVALFISAPYIGLFYGKEYDLLCPVLRVLGIRIIISGFNSVQHAYISKKMLFKKFFWSTLFGTILSAIVGILMAYRGYGVWALVAQYLTNTTVDTVFLQFTFKFRPKLQFSTSRLKTLIQFGSKILLAKLLVTGYQELRALIIGKVYSAPELAYYDRGKQFPTLIVNNVDASISSVLFPRLSNIQDDKEEVKKITRYSIRFGSFIMFPIMLGLLAVSDRLIPALLTEKWVKCIPLLKWFCIVFLFQTVHTSNMQAIKAVGRSDIFLKLEIIKKSIELITFLCVVRTSVNIIVAVNGILATAFVLLNAYPNIKLINYSIKEQISDFAPALCMSCIMCVVVFFVGKVPGNNVVVLILQIIVGVIVYISFSIVTQNQEYLFFKKRFTGLVH